MKKFIALFLTVVMVTGLVACGGTKTKYVAKTATLMGFEASWEELGGGECYIELGSDGTYKFVFDGDTATGAYTQSGETLTLTIEGEQMPATLSGEKLTLDYTYEDSDFGNITYTITFEKQ